VKYNKITVNAAHCRLKCTEQSEEGTATNVVGFVKHKGQQ